MTKELPWARGAQPRGLCSLGVYRLKHSILTFSALQQLRHPHTLPFLVWGTQHKLLPIFHFYGEDIVLGLAAVDWIDLLNHADVNGALFLFLAGVCVVCEVVGAIAPGQDEPAFLPILRGGGETRRENVNRVS